MKKVFSVFLCVCLIITMLATGIVTASAEGNPIDGTAITWSFNAETGALHFDGEGAIPDYENGKDELGNTVPTYPWKDVKFTSVVFGEGITGIGNNAFAYHETLTSIIIPDTVTVLGKGIFYWCSALETVTLPAEVTELGSQLFACSGVKNVTFGAKTETIGYEAFYKCSNLESITLPATLKTIGEAAFSYSALKSLDIPEGVTAIEFEAFNYCKSLETVTLPATLENLGASAFKNCTKLKSIAFPEKITVIPADVCNNCTLLESVTLPETVTEISDYAFHYCKALTAVTIPASVKSIGTKAFGYRSSSSKIDGFTVNGYINSISKAYSDANGFAFNSLGYLTAGECGEGITWEYKDEDKTLYITGTGAMADYTASALPSYAVIPYEKVNIADTVTKIGAYAFYGAAAMDFALSENVAEIGEKAIGYSVGEDGAEILTAGTTITAYDKTAAETYSTANTITFNKVDRPLPTQGECGEGVVWNYIDEEKTLYIGGTGAMADYSLDNPAVYNAHKYEKIVIADTITKIGAYAFYGAAAMDFALSENLTEIGEKAIGYSVGEDGTEILTAGTTITAYEGTAAHEYATTNGVTFNTLGEIPYIGGVCGDNASWTYNKSAKTLVIKGTGAIYDYKADSLPEFAALEIVSITVDDGITAIGNNAFATEKPYGTITLSKDVMSIGKNALGFTIAPVLGEDGQPTDDFTSTPYAELTVNGYIAGPADDYAKAYGFTFNALDTEKYPEMVFNFTNIIDYANGFIYVYSNDGAEAPTMEGFPVDKYETVTAPETIMTGATLSLTDENGTYNYTFIVLGDTKADGKINSTDALMMLQHSVNKITIEDAAQVKAADFNHDGKINSTDALIALQISVEKIDASSQYNPGKIG